MTNVEPELRARIATAPLYGTLDELLFLRGLGSWSTVDTNRATVLRAYIQAAELRANWGAIAKTIVIDEARALLRSS